MDEKDLVLTPVYALLFLALAFVIRPFVSDERTKKYFLSGLLTKFLGAIVLGVVYQFYYGGGDTFNYWHNGSRWIWLAFLDNPYDGLRLMITSSTTPIPDLFYYTQHIWYYREPSSYFIVRLASFFDLFTFHTYSSTALFFATFSFSGTWALFSVLYKRRIFRSRWLVFALLFIPSTIFWGSGILKDSITLGATCWLVFACFQIIENRRGLLSNLIVAFIAALFLYFIKLYILLCFIPALMLWVYKSRIVKVKSSLLRLFVAPILLAVLALVSFLAMNQVSAGNSKYALESISRRAAITAYDIRYGWGATAGGEGGYDIGLLDGTWSSMIKLFPAAVNVTLFRPYLWEAKNPFMFLSAIEALVFLILTIVVVVKKKWRRLTSNSFLVFCLVFSILFAFVVGVSTFNFGSLMRYKIPMLPFYAICLSATLTKKNEESNS